MPFTFQRLSIPDVVLITPKKFDDERGYFEETYKESVFRDFGIDASFFQDNHSFSVKGTLRGLHFQNPPHGQGKLVRCLHGKVLDVAVDIRLGSPTFSKYVSAYLDGVNHSILWIPEGFAHGFLAIEDSHLEYKVTSEYFKDAEDGITWNDPRINIIWGISGPLVSSKDQLWKSLSEKNIQFNYHPGGEIN